MSGGWNTIESDAASPHLCLLLILLTNFFFQGVFTYLVENLGVKNVQFEEMIALDSDYLEQQTCVTILLFTVQVSS